jgi:DNA polymerase III subunit beta
MKIQFDKKVIESALQKVIKAVSPRSPLPILGYVLVKTEGNDKVTFSTTDLEFGIKCQANAKVIEEGSVCVPARIIHDLVGQLQEDKIEIRVESDRSIEIKTEKSKYHINTRETDEFPILPTASDKPLFSIPQSTLKEIIKNVIIAVAGTDEQRAALTGVLVSVDENGLTAVSTDGRRLVKVFEPIDEPPAKKFSVIIPQRSMKEINSLLGEGDSPVNVIFSEGQLFLEFEGVNVFSRIIDGKFPNYEVVIPRTSDIKILVDRKKLLDAAKRALIMALDKDTPDLLRTDMTKESIRIRSNSIDVGDAYEEVHVNEMEGEPLELALNGRYVLEVLNVINDDFIWLLMNNPVMPVMIKSSQKENYIYIVMPVRLHKPEEEEEENVSVHSYS